MRPEKLVLKNIGPFTDQTLDFTELDNLFLIYGKTGAGKTSIFDAITFALYGRLLGTRNGILEKFRSDYAQENDKSYVEFIFTSCGKKYKIWRSLPFEYINRNGKVSKKASEAVLFIWNEVLQEFETSGAGKSETDAFIEQIIGLKYEDFTKIVVLPQGSFAKFLHENSEKKKELLKNIFAIDFYSEIQEKAKLLAEERKKKAGDNEVKLKSLLESFNPDSYEEDKKTFEEKDSELKNKAAVYSDKLKSLWTKNNALESALSDAELKLKLENKKNILEKEKPEIEKLEQILELGNRAKKVCPSLDAENNILEKIRRHTEELNFSKEKLKTEQEKLSAFENQKKEIEKLIADCEEEKIYLGKINDVLKKEQEFKKNKKEELFWNNELNSIQNRINEINNKKETDLKELLSLNGGKEFSSPSEFVTGLIKEENLLERESEKIKLALEDTERYCKLLSQLEEKEKKLEEQKKNLQEKDRDLKQTELLLAEAESEQKKIDMNNHASALFEFLKEGDPCPLCGSIHHPSPVLPNKSLVDITDKIHLLKKSVDIFSAEYHNEESAFMVLENERNNLTSAIEEMENGGVEKELTIAKKKYIEAASLVQQIRNKRISAEQLKADIDGIDEELLSVENELRSVKEKKTVAESSVNMLLNQIKEMIPDFENRNLSVEVKERKVQLADNSAKIEKFNQDYKETELNTVKLKTDSDNLSLQLEKLENEKKESEVQVLKLLSELNFESRQEAKEALLSDASEKIYNDRISNFKESWVVVMNRLEEFKEKNCLPADDLKNQITVLKNEMEQIEKSIEVNSQAAEDNTSAMKILMEKNAEYVKLLKEEKDLKEKSEHYLRLSNDLSGQNPKKKTFEIWLLAMYLAEVIEYANPELKEISNGRYEFVMGEDETGGNGHKGLELSVYDSYSGKIRNTATLSGGETFMASLSLALGLTSVVQQKSGGIRLDSLFIDEGFGTLDQESLDKAISILTSMGEDKMVGIISHVESLVTDIQSHVFVDRGDYGSKIITG